MSIIVSHTRILEIVREQFHSPRTFCTANGLTYCNDTDRTKWYIRSDAKKNDTYQYTDWSGKSASKQFHTYADGLWIAPARTDVRINPDQNAHLIALAVDGSWTTQYIYHDARRTQRDLLKSYELIEFAPAISRIRKNYTHIFQNSSASELDRTLALMMRLEDKWAVRIGAWVHEPDESDGLTSLKTKHFRSDHDQFGIEFTAKWWKQRRIAFERTKINKPIYQCFEKYVKTNKQYLFEDEHGAISPQRFTSAIQSIADEPVSPKEFRTWHWSVEAMAAIVAQDHPTIKLITQHASKKLGNTAAVAQRHYIHPHLLESYRDGEFETFYTRSCGARCKPYLSRVEMDFYEILPHLFDHYMRAND